MGDVGPRTRTPRKDLKLERRSMYDPATTTRGVGGAGEEECTSPRRTNFRSFFSRLGGKSKSLSQLTAGEVEPGMESPKSPTFRNPFNSGPAGAAQVASPPIRVTTVEPLPLYIAYPQAILAASLAATTISPEVILRRNSDVRVKERPKKSRHGHGKGDSLEWTRKLFVLVPGILLQYSADGAVDRMPEKLLQLTAKSVAFASDAFSGRPYVIQVSQTADAGGVPLPIAPEKKPSLFSKITNGKPPTRYATCALLLVFDTAREMEMWMHSIRDEASKLAGTFVPKVETKQSDSSLRKSRRYPVRHFDASNGVSPNSSKRVSRVSQQMSLDTPGPSPSLATTSASSEHLHLERLRRESPTIRQPNNSSPETSPERAGPQHKKSDYEISLENRRRSMAALSTSRSSMETRRQTRPVSSYGSQERGHSPNPRRKSPPTLSIPIPPRNKSYDHALQVPRRSPLDSVSLLSTSVPNRPPPSPTFAFGTSPSTSKTPVRMRSESRSHSPSLNLQKTLDTPSRTPPPPSSSTSTTPTPTAPKPPQLTPRTSSQHQSQSRPALNPRRQRPVSMFDTKHSDRNSRGWPSHPHLTVTSAGGLNIPPLPTTHTTPPTTTSNTSSPTKNPRSLKRRSMTALAASQCQYVPSPPMHPPPSIPLPQIPIDVAGWKPHRVATPRKSSPSLGNRHSFCVVRVSGEGERH